MNWSAAEVERLRLAPWLGGVEFHERLGSTNDHALAQAAAWPTPYLIVAAEQSAGRGRGDRRWWGGPGSLLMSLVLDAPGPMERWPQLALVAGLAVVDALRPLLEDGERRLRLKWPNDVHLDGRKLCGMLIESATRAGRVVLGIGLNVNNSLAAAPAEVRGLATSLVDAAPGDWSLAEVTLRLLEQLEQATRRWSAGELDLRDRWPAYCLLQGRPLRIHQPDGAVVAGIAAGLDRDGALLVAGERGMTRCVAGHVELLDGT